MKAAPKKKRLKPRLPVEAVLRLGSRPVTTKKGAKGYDRERSKTEALRTVQEETG